MPVDAQLADLDRRDEESLGRPTIARALVAAGFARDVQDAFDRVVGPGGPGYVRREALGPIDALAAIRGAGGLPVLAHFASAPERPALIRELIEAGLGGIEVHHRSFDAATVERMRTVATAHRLVPSGGTDFHGDEGSYADAIGETWIPDDVADGDAGGPRRPGARRRRRPPDEDARAPGPRDRPSAGVGRRRPERGASSSTVAWPSSGRRTRPCPGSGSGRSGAR